MGGGDHFGSHGGGFGGGYSNGGYSNGVADNGPPYIIKLLNLPITSDDSFVKDLFQSRFTPYAKFKIVVDPISNILETRVIKKVAFVELQSFQDLTKSLKWLDLYYNDRRRVVVEKADHRDFMECMNFNQQHATEIDEIVNDFVNHKNQPGGPFRDQHTYSPERSHATMHHAPPRSGPLNPHLGLHGNTNPNLGHSLHAHPHLNVHPHLHELPPLQPPQPADPPRKFNPFGAAKPVDVVSKQHEIEKKLIMVNHTTIKTIGDSRENINSQVGKPKEDIVSVANSGSTTNGPTVAIPVTTTTTGVISNGEKPKFSLLQYQYQHILLEKV